jgi:hypothetical protein
MTKAQTIVFVLICLILIALGGFFILNYHKDSLKNQVPAEVSLYIHSYPQVINSLPSKYFSLISANLNKSGLTEDELQNIFKLATKEIAVFKTPGSGYQIITFYNQPLEALLRQNRIQFTKCGETIIFPSTNNACVQNSLAKNVNYSPSKWNFSKLTLYYSSQEALFFPEYLEKNYMKPFFAYLYEKESFNQPYYFIKTDLTTDLAFEPKQSYEKETGAEEKTTLYAQSLDFSKLNLQVGNTRGNFKYQLLQAIGKVYQMMNYEGDSMAVVAEKSVGELESVIKKRLSYLAPSEEIKLLPDNTQAINLVANPNVWEFETASNGERLLAVKKLNLAFKLKPLASNNALTLLTIDELDQPEPESSPMILNKSKDVSSFISINTNNDFTVMFQIDQDTGKINVYLNTIRLR